MCVSMAPGIPVHFAETIVYAAEVETPGAGWVHVLGYQNAVQNRAGASLWERVRRSARRRWGAPEQGAQGNAMLLPFPAVPGSMTATNAIDMSGCPGALRDMQRALEPAMARSKSSRLSLDLSRAPAVQVFEVSGVYTVVLAQDARAIPGALERVPEARRPALNPALMEAYAAWYPGWTLALCCFEARRLTRAAPLVWWYAPADPTRLFMPGLDCHTGDVPDLSADVDIDHALLVASLDAEGTTAGWEGWGAEGFVSWSAALPKARVDTLGLPASRLFPANVAGEFHVDGSLANGDWWCSVDEVRRGVFQPARLAPPGAGVGG